METGQISIHADNILPIIKKWLYSEKEIYLRELVANAADAIFKLGKIALVEDGVEAPEAAIVLAIDKERGVVTISDTGVGLTEDEVRKYINQVAFSGVADFLEKYKDKDDTQQVIGHFGLGFYSAFMVASQVEIDSLSYQPGAAAVHWSCDGSTSFTLSPGTRTTVGTTITLKIADDSKEMLEEGTLERLVARYCAFIRYPIKLAGKDEPLNDPRPLFTRNAAELSDKDYIDFFHELFPGSPDPLFWLHLNVDYPFKLSGIVYFPKLKHELDASQGEIKLYCNQVYVADNVKELIPDWLTLLKGVVDCPDLPLNVSRSYLQNDPTVARISEHITKKVADKLSGLAKTDPESFHKFWDDIHPFIKFGMMRDARFFERMKDVIVFKTTAGEHLTLAAYEEKMKGKLDDGTVLYVTDQAAQAAYVRLLREHEMEAVIADTMIDSHFIPFFEAQTSRKWKFKRVDADLSQHLLSGASASNIVVDAQAGATRRDQVDKIFRDHLAKTGVKVRVEALKSGAVPAMLLFDEQARRMKEMMARGMPDFPFGASGAGGETLVVNETSPVVQNLLRLAGAFNREEDVGLVVNQIYDLAWLQQGAFNAEMMQGFLDRSSAILSRLGGESTPGASAPTTSEA